MTLLVKSSENSTAGMVCAHHHLYSTLARGMPAPHRTPRSFLDVLEQIWWRLDAALDLEMIYWSAALGALEALTSGTTVIIDHHESPFAIEGSLDAIAQACALVGVRVVPSYGVTDRWNGNSLQVVTPNTPTSRGAEDGLAEMERYLATGRRAMVGIHAAFTCGDETLAAASELAQKFDVGVHVHVAEGPDDAISHNRLRQHATSKWLIVHGVHLTEPIAGTLVHNPRSNMNNAVGYARPHQWNMPVALGTDGIGADMLEEFRIAFVAGRADDVTFSPDTAWSWIQEGYKIAPEALDDQVIWNYEHVAEPWFSSFTPGVRAIDVDINGQAVLRNGKALLCDADEIRAKANEQSQRLHRSLL